MAKNSFDDAFHTAKVTGDWGHVISLYIQAATGLSEAFNLTHAYIHALEAGDERAGQLKARLIGLGAEVEDATD